MSKTLIKNKKTKVWPLPLPKCHSSLSRTQKMSDLILVGFFFFKTWLLKCLSPSCWKAPPYKATEAQERMWQNVTDLHRTGLRILAEGMACVLKAAERKIKLSYCFSRDFSAFTTQNHRFISLLVFALCVIFKSPHNIKANYNACYSHRFLCTTVKLSPTLSLAPENHRFDASKK